MQTVMVSLKAGVLRIIVYSTCIVFCLLTLYGCGVSKHFELLMEKGAVRDAARRYLEAELKRDFDAVYASLSPSSVYRSRNSYKQYLDQAKAAPQRLVEFRIKAISYLTDNHDRVTYPRIEKFVRVEVELVLVDAASNERTEVNADFTFIKEEGRWYKG